MSKYLRIITINIAVKEKVHWKILCVFRHLRYDSTTNSNSEETVAKILTNFSTIIKTNKSGKGVTDCKIHPNIKSAKKPRQKPIKSAKKIDRHPLNAESILQKPRTDTVISAHQNII
jgi:hypothetical protein